MDSKPGHGAIIETEESQLWASGPDNNHGRFLQKIDIKSTAVDSGNSPTTTLRGGLVMGLRDSDSMGYPYDADATNGDQKVVGVIPQHLSMLNKLTGAVEDKFSRVMTAGILKNFADLIGEDKHVAAVLARIGFRFAQLDPHGSCFGLHLKTRYFKAADYTLVDADHGCMFVATAACNFTLPSLATVGKGYEVLLFNGAAATMVVTGAADSINTGDAAGGLSTTITFSTANRQRGGSVLMLSDYAGDGGSLVWYPLFVSGTPTYA